MLANIRKHQGWLWIIIALVVISFVLWTSQTQKLTGAMSGSADYGSVMGRPVSQEQFVNALNEARLRYFFNNGEWPDQNPKHDFDQEKETYFRLLIIREIEALGIHVSSESIGEMATARILQFTRGQSMPLNDFVTRVLAPLDDEDFARYLDHEVGLEQLVALEGASGRMVTPEEIRGLYQREHEEVSVQAVFFQATNFLPEVSVSTPGFMQYYTNAMAKYHLPERVQVNYVRFAASNLMVEASNSIAKDTNFEDVVEANYEHLGTNFDSEDKTPEAKKAKIRQMMLDKQSLVIARKKANELTDQLGAMDPKQGNLALLAKTNGLAVHLSEPFDQDTPPEDLNVGPDFAEHAFELGPDEPYFGPIMGDGAAYVIELARRLPDENPPFEKIRDRVLADYKLNQAIMLARLAGGQFYGSLTNSVNRGKSFVTICAASGLRPEFLPPLSISSTNGTLPDVEERVPLNRFKEAVFGTPVGQVSPFVPDDDGGFVVYVRSKLPIDESQMQAELPIFAARVEQNRAYEAFNMWFNHEIQRGLHDTPFMQRLQRQQQQGASGPPPQN